MTDDELRAAALKRAEGNGWDPTAKAIGWKSKDLQAWVKAHADRWKKAYREAEETVSTESGAEGIALLREQLRDEDIKIVRDAAYRLVQLRLAARRLEVQMGEPTIPDTRAGQFAALFGGLTDDELDRLLAEDRGP